MNVCILLYFPGLYSPKLAFLMDSRKLAQIIFLAIPQNQNCLSQPGLLKASVEKTGLTMEHTLEGPLRCQRENSWREYFVTQEE